MTTCTHVEEIRDLPRANPDSCPECVKEGNPYWVQLRQCLICGHVGCCDSSPRQHASAHFHDTTHPIIQTIEPGQDWRWCFVDETLI